MTLTYEQAGIALYPEKELIEIDLNQPRTILVKARNEETGIVKSYVLKITTRGLCLV